MLYVGSMRLPVFPVDPPRSASRSVAWPTGAPDGAFGPPAPLFRVCDGPLSSGCARDTQGAKMRSPAIASRRASDLAQIVGPHRLPDHLVLVARDVRSGAFVDQVEKH